MIRRTVAVALIASCAVLTQMPAASATEQEGGQLQALQRDLGLSVQAAQQRMVQEDAAARLQEKLVPVLGKAFAGAWFDPQSGALTVAVTEKDAADRAGKAGARTKLVARSLTQLDVIKADADRVAKESGIVATAVDPRTNEVVVTTTKGAKFAARDGVRIEETAGVPSLTKDYLDGGEIADMPAGDCSIGFNAVDAANNARMITAGHCAAGGNPVRGNGGVVIGNYVASNWREGNDFAMTSVDTNAWYVGPWVAMHTPTDQYTLVRGSTPAPVGASVCKSGITTKWTCGVINVLNETVYLQDGTRVDGLTRHNACSERGDSGGSNISGEQAQGVSSLAALYGNTYRCGQAVGQPTISWFQPVNEILSAYNLRLRTW